MTKKKSSKICDASYQVKWVNFRLYIVFPLHLYIGYVLSQTSYHKLKWLKVKSIYDFSWGWWLLVSAGQFFYWSLFCSLADGSSWSEQSQNSFIYMPGIDTGYWLRYLNFLPCGFSSCRDVDKFTYRMLFGFQRAKGKLPALLRSSL